MSNTLTVAGITYSKPTVVLLQETGIGTAEIAARTCYDSFDASENKSVQALNSQLGKTIKNNLGFPSLSGLNQSDINHVNKIEHSDLLDKLSWTHFHHSILEHANLTYLIKGTSRGVLQEHARHRIQSISVRSTRYTMSSVINAFVAAKFCTTPANTEYDEDYAETFFIEEVSKMNMFITTQEDYIYLEAQAAYAKLNLQYGRLGPEEFYTISTPKSSKLLFEEAASISASPKDFFTELEVSKSKRNVGDAFKHIVTDNWKVDMVVTFNLRSLKNYFTLRDSGAAFFQIRWLSQAMKAATPSKYLDLIVKPKG